MEIQTEITYNDVVLIVHGYYTKEESQTYDYPGSPSEFQIHEVYTETNEVNIYDILNFATLNDIEELSIDQIENK
mgnify:CR=1 FL=1|tara:strand:- start:403 stop:627 length:225 start_codon:yes stop_codon:yes gene_type:complete